MWALVFPKSKVVFIAFWEHTEISKIIRGSGRKWKPTCEKIFWSWNAGPLSDPSQCHPDRCAYPVCTRSIGAIPREVSLSNILLLPRTLPARNLLSTTAEVHGKNCHLPVNQKFFNYGRLLCLFSVFCWCHSRRHLIWSLTADHIFPITSVYAALGSVSSELRVFLCFPGMLKGALHVGQAMLLPSSHSLIGHVHISSLFRRLIIMAMMVLLVFCPSGIIIKGNWCQ